MFTRSLCYKQRVRQKIVRNYTVKSRGLLKCTRQKQKKKLFYIYIPASVVKFLQGFMLNSEVRRAEGSDVVMYYYYFSRNATAAYGHRMVKTPASYLRSYGILGSNLCLQTEYIKWNIRG
jgi:hypothetical protein